MVLLRRCAALVLATLAWTAFAAAAWLHSSGGGPPGALGAPGAWVLLAAARPAGALDTKSSSSSPEPSGNGSATPLVGIGRACVVAPARQRELLEDNAPRLPPQAHDEEVASEVADVLPGAEVGHFHGKLGRWPDGSCCRIRKQPLPVGGLSMDEKHDAHRGFCFDSRASESVEVDRAQRDVRSVGCRQRHEAYPCDLPTASVVMVFHNEHFVTLIRSLHSVLNNSPPRYLREIVLVDDASAPDEHRFYERHWERLQGELTEYVKALPKVRLVRVRQRRGLMVARMEAIWRARGEVIVCLDSHIEATPGWLEPLLARIVEKPHHVVVPSIDGVDTEDFSYTVFGVGLLSFSWTLAQKPLERLDGSDEPKASSVMCGGLFAADRAFFLHLGGYDTEMRTYGGEEVEIGFRTWQCGGAIEHVPCSHVGHIWRSNRYWQGSVYTVPGEDVVRNKLRTAEIWMDEYKELVRLASPRLPTETGLGSLEQRRSLRKKLGCKPFSWFLDNVAKEVPFPSRAPGGGKRGALIHLGTGACLSSAGQEEVGELVRVQPCDDDRGQGVQSAVMDETGHIRPGLSSFCLAGGKEKPKFYACGSDENSGPQWRWRAPVPSRRGIGTLSLGDSQRCLEVHSNGWLNFSLALGPCYSHGAFQQLWLWELREPTQQAELSTDPGKEVDQ